MYSAGRDGVYRQLRVHSKTLQVVDTKKVLEMNKLCGFSRRNAWPQFATLSPIMFNVCPQWVHLWIDFVELFLFNCEDCPVDHDNLPNKLCGSLFTRRLYIQDTRFSLLLRASQSACLLIYKALYKLIIMVGGMGLLDFSSFHY